jgi:Protein of unknown function (DUF2489)
MNDRQARTENEILARKQVVSFAQAMLEGKLPFLEGAYKLDGLSHRVGGVSLDDPDFLLFSAISSETDHLPFDEQRPLWQPEALKRLEPEIKERENWARSMATAACRSLIDRFDDRT